MGLDESSAARDLHLSDGEIHFLWHFIQGSFMDPETRTRLRRGWGMCPRHSLGFLAVDAAFRHAFPHGPAILYEDLMSQAHAAFSLSGPFRAERTGFHLRATGPCHMCDLGYGPASPGQASREILERGRNLTEIRRFALATEPYWRRAVCGRCAGNGSTRRCRIHLREGLIAGADPGDHVALVQDIAHHIRRYSRSFVWELQDTETVEDRAALVAAVGWCSGWRPWLWLVGWSVHEPD